MRKDLISSVVAVVALTVIFGLAYPLVITGVSQVVFPGRADGSQIKKDGKVVGSRLIGQDFSARPRRCSRPARRRPATTRPAPRSRTSGRTAKDLKDNIVKYAADATCGSNAPYNPGLTRAEIPPDAVQTSASGVDPQISVANARIQAGRVARARPGSRRRGFSRSSRTTPTAARSACSASPASTSSTSTSRSQEARR